MMMTMTEEKDLEPRELILKVTLYVGHIFFLPKGSLCSQIMLLYNFLFLIFGIFYRTELLFGESQTLKALAVHTPANTWIWELGRFKRFKSVNKNGQLIIHLGVHSPREAIHKSETGSDTDNFSMLNKKSMNGVIPIDMCLIMRKTI